MSPAEKFGQHQKTPADGEDGIGHAANDGGLPEPGEHLVPDARSRGSRGRADGELPAWPDSERSQRHVPEPSEVWRKSVAVICGKMRVRAHAAQIGVQPGSVSRG